MKIELWQGGAPKSMPALCTVEVAEDEVMSFLRLMGSQSIKWRIPENSLESDDF